MEIGKMHEEEEKKIFRSNLMNLLLLEHFVHCGYQRTKAILHV